ncbi:amidohydrolase family protein [candidate division KSB1 bacterium]|nr:amidohydrolase family protein [candidate division KSB1 bacterium]
MKKRLFILLFCLSGLACRIFTFNFADTPKIDAHVHIDTAKPDIITLAKADRFSLLTLVTQSSDNNRINRQRQFAQFQHDKYPKDIGWATTFYMGNWSEPGWQDSVIQQLGKDFKSGAIAVKVWKDIGMTFRDSQGRFIKIDDPSLDPILDYIAGQKIPLVGHIGEPRNCWLPLDSMTVNSDRHYFENQPQYHMYLHPDYPSYEDQIDARDNMLAKHPDLKMIGAHLASLEWDVDQLATRLDRFPNLAVDTAARICHFQVQDRDKVRNFIIKYQDRILYGTDMSADDDTDKAALDQIHQVWLKDWAYFTTDAMMESEKVNEPFKGLALPREVVKKIYYKNAKNWYPGL